MTAPFSSTSPGAAGPRTRRPWWRDSVIYQLYVRSYADSDADGVGDLDGVTEVYSVTGEIDLVAMVRVRVHEELADVIPGGLNKVPGVTQPRISMQWRWTSRRGRPETGGSSGAPRSYGGGR